MRVILPGLLCFLVSFFSPPQNIRAEEVSFVVHDFGIAMTGDPAQGKDADHLSYANPDAPKGGKLNRSEIGTFDTVNPFSIKGTAASGLGMIYDKLTARSWDEPFTLYPLIAETLEVPEDRSALIVHINPKAKFNDGTPITADDLLFSFETLKEKGRPNMRRIYQQQVASVEKLAPLSVKFTFGGEYNRETVMILAMMPVLSQAWWHGRNFDETLLEMPNANGPYLIKDLQPGNRITYARNPDYWAADLFANKGFNNFDEISFTYFRDDTTALESFLKGDIDLRYEFDPRKWNTQYNADGIDKQEFPHRRPQKVDAMIFNLRRPLFNDLNVRKALFLSFDGDWVRDTIFQNTVERTNSYFPNSILSANLPIYGADMDKRTRLHTAKKLLEQAGWHVERNQLVKNGQPFRFEILFNQAKDEKIALSFAQSLKRLGITATARRLDSAAFQNRLMDYDYDMVLHNWQNSLSPGTEQMVYWGCDAAQQPGRFNYAGICDPTIDATAKAIADARSYAALTEQAHTLDRELIGQFMSIPLFYSGADRIALRKNALGYPEKTPLYGPIIETWWAADQR
ncbi:MAG: ABC transporter substrate-binding protein [Rhodospirillales bacterium]|nr:ABC transporter substrate-binding protein [Rhodospirillales bacterium]